jgi:hypothetical protein
MSKCTTTCWNDCKRRFKILEAHKIVGLKNGSLTNYKGMNNTVASFVESGNNFMNSGALKSSLQSDVGALSRRSKLGAEAVHLTHKGIPVINNAKELTVFNSHRLLSSITNNRGGWFGNPTVRAVSKLSYGVMQTTLKVKSLGGGVTSNSSLMSLLCGSEECIRVDTRGTWTVVRSGANHNWKNTCTACNLYALRKYPPDLLDSAIHEFITVVVNECGRSFDSAELECLRCIAQFLIPKVTSPLQGIEIQTMGKYSYLRPMIKSNACYFNTTDSSNDLFFEEPTTVFERLLLGNCSSLKGINS